MTLLHFLRSRKRESVSKSRKKEAPQFPDLLLHQVGVRGLPKKILAQTPVTVDTRHSNPPSLNFTIYITSIFNCMLPHWLHQLNELLIVHDSHMKLSSERGMSALPMLIMLYDTQRSKQLNPLTHPGSFL